MKTLKNLVKTETLNVEELMLIKGAEIRLTEGCDCASCSSCSCVVGACSSVACNGSACTSCACNGYTCQTSACNISQNAKVSSQNATVSNKLAQL